jgi:hypothetical protein
MDPTDLTGIRDEVRSTNDRLMAYVLTRTSASIV